MEKERKGKGAKNKFVERKVRGADKRDQFNKREKREQSLVPAGTKMDLGNATVLAQEKRRTKMACSFLDFSLTI